MTDCIDVSNGKIVSKYQSATQNYKELSKFVADYQSKTWEPTKWGRKLFGPDWAARVVEDTLYVRNGYRQEWREFPITANLAVSYKQGFHWGKVQISGPEIGPDIKLTGAKNAEAEALTEVIQAACTKATVDHLRTKFPAIESIGQNALQELKSDCWVTTSNVDKVSRLPSITDELRRYAKTIEGPHTSLSKLYLSLDELFLLKLVSNPQEGIQDLADIQNKEFLKCELEKYEDFFDSVEKNPLTSEQREAAITFDDNVLTIAAAGSGKTSTLVAKAGYAIKSGLVEPKQTLLLAFNSDAGDELQERVNDQLSKTIKNANEITVSTFHAFGLSVIGKATGEKPRVAPWIHQGKDIEVLSEIVSQLCADSKFADDWKLFRTVYARPLPEFGKKDEPEFWDPETQRRGFRTIRGEVVKSKEEFMIANWLALNGVDYEYECKYEQPTATADRSQYHPDFFYPGANLYHEHFALDKNGQPPPDFLDYGSSVLWKRRIHQEHGTKLIETTSYSIRQPGGFQELRKKLKSNSVKFGVRPLTDEEREAIPDATGLLRTIRTFLVHVKSNRLAVADLRERSNSGIASLFGHKAREQLYIKLFEKIWKNWEARLSKDGYVDFEDMLSKAVDLIAAGKYESPYKLVMADEFQDTSIVRGLMLRELTKGPDTRLFAVGDDWQAINRFAGADISLMKDFDSYFGPNSVVKLSKSFRCPKEICDVAGQFVSKNSSQIAKTVSTTNRRTANSIICFEVEDLGDPTDLVEKHLDQLAQKMKGRRGSRASVIFMGRYNDDRPKGFRKWKEQYADALDLSWSTIHGSKGLEADYIFLLNLVQKRRGFPSHIEDDPILQLAMPSGESFPFAEERRLFYVALTRANEMVLLYTEKHRKSEFLVELQKDGAIEIRNEGSGSASEPCPKCARGVLVVRNGKFGEFLSCSRFPRCDYRRTCD